MKKTYITPLNHVANLHTEHMLAVSVPVDNSTEINGSDAYSNHRGWSSTNWMKKEEE
ncbi:MAG: hypothetical protein J6C15_07060 [Bacteroidaceae bacterium]|nr:hypothetical protein [Bacteroidaceae bacterium]